MLSSITENEALLQPLTGFHVSVGINDSPTVYILLQFTLMHLYINYFRGYFCNPMKLEKVIIKV